MCARPQDSRVGAPRSVGRRMKHGEPVAPRRVRGKRRRAARYFAANRRGGRWAAVATRESRPHLGFLPQLAHSVRRPEGPYLRLRLRRLPGHPGAPPIRYDARIQFWSTKKQWGRCDRPWDSRHRPTLDSQSGLPRVRGATSAVRAARNIMLRTNECHGIGHSRCRYDSMTEDA